MTFGQLRRNRGMTITDLALAANMSIEYITAIEEGRRVPNERDVATIAPILDVATKDLIDWSTIDSEDKDVSIEAIGKFGSFPGASIKPGYFNESFVPLINDVWRIINSHELLFSLEQLSKTLIDYTKTKHSFPFSVFGVDSPLVVWVDMYDANQTVDGRPTIIIEHVSGISIEYEAENIIHSLVKEILYPMRWIDTVSEDYKRQKKKSILPSIFGKSPIKTKEQNDYNDIWYEEIRFLQRERIHDTFDYHEITIRGGESVIEYKVNFELKMVDDTPSRIYRRIMKARDLPNPFPKNNGNDRCEPPMVGKCPLVTQRIPDKNNGCPRCRHHVKTWNGRNWLLSRMSDKEIEGLRFFKDFMDKKPKEFKQFLEEFAENNNEEARELWDSIIIASSYYYVTTGIKLDSKIYTNGRHRTKVAQILDIDIPVQWITEEKMDEELIEYHL